jgi:hypothetical protein
MASDVHYVYAIVPPTTASAAAPAGIDGRPVELVVNDDVAALVSRVDAAVYGANLDDRVADVTWLAPRATAHDQILTWASDIGAVVPLPLFSLFRSADAVRSMLAERRDELRALLEKVARGREYGVRIFRLDEELKRSLASFSAPIAALEMEVAGAASPGQAYLLARKLDATRKDELRRVASEVATAAYNALGARSIAAVEDALPKPNVGQAGAAVLNASFLVAHDRIDEFRAVVTELVREHERRGFRVEFTGPWPPYHFTRGPRAE